ncbi:glycosyltransferase family 2 protein [Moheibacter sediminis]|nr:glycosyltransferase family 2 protein [Moheibacter sediminis]
MKYCIIIPTRNEEKFIGQTLQSIVGQSFLPSEVIIVNDNSTDKTAEIVNEFSLKFPFMKIIHSGNQENKHEPGSKIIEAFYKGFDELKSNWDVVTKLDADVILPSDYFEKIILSFEINPKIGIAGGLVYINKNEEWIYEKISNKKHVRGAIKSYSRACFIKMGGVKKSIGWDTVDELLAQFYGFEIAVFSDLKVKLLKPTGNDYKKIHGQKTGSGFYKMDYGWLISLIAALKASWNSKNPNLFFSISKGYWNSALKHDNKIVTKEEGKFIRTYRWKKILNRFVNHS